MGSNKKFDIYEGWRYLAKLCERLEPKFSIVVPRVMQNIAKLTINPCNQGILHNYCCTFGKFASCVVSNALNIDDS